MLGWLNNWRLAQNSAKHLAMMATIVLVLSYPSAWGKDASRILIVHSYHQFYPWTEGQNEGFMESLNGALELTPQVESEHLDTKRLAFTDVYAEQFADYLAAKYRTYKPDAIYVTDDNALIFGLEHLSRVFPDTPLFFSGVNNFEIQTSLDPKRQTGIFEKKDPATNLDLLAGLTAGSSQLCIVGDASRTHALIEQQVRETLSKRSRISARYIGRKKINALEKALESCSGIPVLLTTVGSVKNAGGAILPLQEIIRRVVKTTSSIVLSMEDAYVTEGVLGGFVTSGPTQGRAAGNLLVQYLTGTPMERIAPVTESPNTYLFDDRVIHELGVHLPAKIARASTLLHPVPSFYQKHHRSFETLLVALILVLLTLLGIYAIRVTQSNRLLHQQSKTLRSQGKQLEESEEKYRLLFELSEDPMLIIRGKEFVIANKATVRLLGYNNLEELQKVHPSLLSPDFQSDGRPSYKKADEMMQIAYEQGYHRFEWTHQRRDGTPIEMEVSLTRIPYAGSEALFCLWHDLTKRIQAENKLLEKTTYLNSVLSASVKVGFIATDMNLKINYFNERAAEIFGVAPQEMEGKDVFFFHEGLKHAKDEQVFAALATARKQGEWRFSLKRTDLGEIRYIDARISPIQTEENKLAGYMLMAEDVTKQHQAEELIKRQAAYDELTDLPNRRTLLERLNQELANCKRHHHKGALLFLDLDNFKHVNDSFGHPIGDALLKHIANLMKQEMRDEDTVARLGGDEFVILLNELADNIENALSRTQVVADKLLRAINKPLHFEGHELRVNTSIGITVFPREEESADDLLRQADTALYQAKEAGRNTFRFFSPEMQAQAERRVMLVNSLNQAIERQEFEVYLQPQIDITGKLYGAEALVRWQHPDKGIVSPDEFIPLAEETGLIESISNQVLSQTLEAQKRWTQQYPGNPPPKISINLSAKQFEQADFAEKMIQTFQELEARTDLLTLELTESMLIGLVDPTIEKMRALKNLGVRFSIDDFGTGYSSLAYLKRLPLDEIKIDRSFIRDIPTDTNDTALVDMVLGLSEKLKLDVVAEGVETQEASHFLQSRGCRVMQGYYFSKPIPISEFEQTYIANRNWVFL